MTWKRATKRGQSGDDSHECGQSSNLFAWYTGYLCRIPCKQEKKEEATGKDRYMKPSTNSATHRGKLCASLAYEHGKKGEYFPGIELKF